MHPVANRADRLQRAVRRFESYRFRAGVFACYGLLSSRVRGFGGGSGLFQGCSAGAWGCVAVVTGWGWPRRPVLDAVDWTGNLTVGLHREPSGPSAEGVSVVRHGFGIGPTLRPDGHRVSR